MRRSVRLGIAVAAAALLAAACSSSSGTSASGGKPVTGGTATFAEPPGVTPNYIFPMLTAAYYSVANIEEFQRLSFRSLYWIGNGKGQPVVDPALSLAALPVYSDNDSVVTIHLGNYTWSDGQPVTTRDVAFWINLLRANKADFAAYIPGEFPDNLKSYKIVNSKTIVLTLTGSFNPTWFTYDQLSQITPLPAQAWDKTSASGKVGQLRHDDGRGQGGVRVPDRAVEGHRHLRQQPAVEGRRRAVEAGQLPDRPATRSSPPTGPTRARASPGSATSLSCRSPATPPSSTCCARATTIDYGYLPTEDASQSSELASARLHHRRSGRAGARATS